jgi:OOP family OmpA-OmpF porin
VLSRPRQPNAGRYEGPVLVTGAIHFDYDDYSIKPESFPALDKIGEALTQPPLEEAIINVEGHTDSDGSDEYNQKLSERRAWSVKSYLVQKFGMDPNRLVIVGYGERAPLADNNSDQGKAQNRRVEFENVTDLYKSQVIETGGQQASGQ